MNLWSKWNDCHDYPSQVDRQDRAREANPDATIY